MGGVMVFLMKDLFRWLEENFEFVVVLDWIDIVK